MALFSIVFGIHGISSINGQLEIPDATIISEDETSESINSTASNPFLKYYDEDLGFGVEYPNNWEVGSGSNAYQIVLFSAPDDTTSVANFCSQCGTRLK